MRPQEQTQVIRCAGNGMSGGRARDVQLSKYREPAGCMKTSAAEAELVQRKDEGSHLRLFVRYLLLTFGKLGSVHRLLSGIIPRHEFEGFHVLTRDSLADPRSLALRRLTASHLPSSDDHIAISPPCCVLSNAFLSHTTNSSSRFSSASIPPWLLDPARHGLTSPLQPPPSRMMMTCSIAPARP